MWTVGSELIRCLQTNEPEVPMHCIKCCPGGREWGSSFALGVRRGAMGTVGALNGFSQQQALTDEDTDAVPSAEAGEAGARAGPGGAMGPDLKMGCHLSKRGR